MIVQIHDSLGAASTVSNNDAYRCTNALADATDITTDPPASPLAPTSKALGTASAAATSTRPTSARGP